MASTTVPKEHKTLKGKFGDYDWEVFEAHTAAHGDKWGFSLEWGTYNSHHQYEEPDLYNDPDTARGQAFFTIARWENEEIKQSDMMSYCQHMEDSESPGTCPECGDPTDYCQGHGELG